jgi:peptide/nickel transport system permease protein
MATIDTPFRIPEPLWRIRMRASWKSLAANWALFAQNRIGLIGLGIIAFFGLMAILHPILMNTVWDPKIYDPFVGNDPLIYVHPSPPSATHLLGTDPMGRDVLSQLMYSTSNEFVLGLLAALITVVIATSIGAIAAYFGGWIDSICMRLADLVNLLPFFALLVVLSSFVRMDMFMLALVIGILSGFGGSTIIFKAQALTIKVKPYIEAARAYAHYLPPYRAQFDAVGVLNHDDDGHERHFFRGGAVVLWAAEHPHELGHYDLYHPDCRIYATQY